MPQKKEMLKKYPRLTKNPLRILKKLKGALRMSGVPFTRSVINAVTRGIVLANDTTLLVENGDLFLTND